MDSPTSLLLHNFRLPIYTPRLVLRPPTPGEGTLLHEAALESREELETFMPWGWQTNLSPDESEIFVRQAAANWILRNSDEPWLQFFIIEKQTNTVLGLCNLHHINWDVPCFEIGYWLRTSKTGHGFMSEAINALTHYLFEELHAERVEIRTDINNIRSQQVPKRLGYHLEATLKSNRLDPLTGQVSDTVIFVRHNTTGLPPLLVEWE